MDKQLFVNNKKYMKEKNHDLSRINAVADSKMISNNIVKMKNHKLLKICFFRNIKNKTDFASVRKVKGKQRSFLF